MRRAIRLRDLNTTDYWDMTHDRYARQDAYALIESERVEKAWPLLLLLIPKTGRLLDMGCSAGLFLRFLARHRPGLELVGCDYSRVAIAHAQERVPAARLVVGDALFPAFRPGVFDIVYSGHLIEHVKTPWVALLWQRWLLRPGGLLIVNFPYADAPYVEHVWDDIHYRDLERGLRGHFRRMGHLPPVPGPPVDEGIIWAVK